MGYSGMGSKYADRPNLLRVAAELTRCKNPDKALEAMRLALKSGVDNFADGQKNFSLPIS